MAESYHGMSPYCSMGNNPIKFTDPNGDDIGMLGQTLIGAGIGAIVGYGIAYLSAYLQDGHVSEDDAKNFGWAALAGAGIGASAGAGNANGWFTLSGTGGGAPVNSNPRVARAMLISGTNTEWSGLYKSDLNYYAVLSGRCTICTDQQLGRYFEDIFADYMSGVISTITNFQRNDNLWNFNTGRNTVPDFTSDSYYARLWPPSIVTVEEGSAYELKANNKGLYLSSNTYQVKGHIDNLREKTLTHINATRNPLTGALGWTPDLTLVTTYDVPFSPGIAGYAAEREVQYTHRRAQFRIINGTWQFRFVGFGLSRL